MLLWKLLIRQVYPVKAGDLILADAAAGMNGRRDHTEI
jgi:hypothetical protein